MIFKLKCKTCGNIIFYGRADTAKQKSVANIIDKVYLILHRNNESLIALEKILTDYFNSSH